MHSHPVIPAVAALLCASATAVPIAIVNHSFEDDVIPRNGNPANHSANADDWLLSSSATSIVSGWTIWDDGRNNGNNGNYGLASFAGDSWWLSQLDGTPEADANDQAFFSAQRDLYQVLGAPLQAGTTYTLTIDIGDRVGGGNAGSPGTPEIHLGYGATPGSNYLISLDNTSLPAQVDSEWVTWTAQFTTGASPAGEGQSLRLELNNGTNVGWFDNVRLDATPAQPFSLSVEDNGDHRLLLRWPSRGGWVYDLLFDAGTLGSVPRESWATYQDNSEMAATPPENTLVIDRPPGFTTGFFTIRERAPSPPPATPVKVFLLGGQSNMQGSGTVVADLPAELQSPQNDLPFFHSGSLTTLRPGSGLAYGPEITFGRTVADAHSSETFALIKYAASATDLQNQWNPTSGASYTAFRNTVTSGLNALTNAGYTPEIVGMLWTQGERDARQGYGPQYESNLTAFILDIRTRYGQNLPFFVSQLSSLQTDLPATGLAEVRQAQANVAGNDPNTHLIVTDTFAMRSDNLHFSSAGQISLGQAFATAYNALMSRTP